MIRSYKGLAGPGWMVVAGLNFVAVTAIVKHVGTGIPPVEAAFLRYILGLVFILPMIKPILRARLDGRDYLLFGCRGIVQSLAVMLWFYAMTQITIAEVTSMNYLAPVYITLGAALFLGEPLALRRILAVCAALVGAVIILRPGIREISPGHLAMLATAPAFASSYLIAKRLSDRLSPAVIVGVLSITVSAVLAPMAFAVWVTPTLTQLFWLFLVALFATAGHYTMTLAFRSAPVSTTQPVTFLQLVWSAILGSVVFGEAIDFWVILGGTIVVAAASFIAWREALLASRSKRRKPAVPD